MNLIIVESPTKAKTLSRFLGGEYAVEATTGHIKDLPKSSLGVDVENNFKPDYQMVEKRKDTIRKIKAASKKVKNVYIATDPDREGEAIAQHVKEVISEDGKDGLVLRRIAFHEITKSAVEEAISNPREIDANLVDAQTARRVLDRLVGYKLSPILWKKVRRGLSAGRVQTVCVRLIVEKEREIEAFKSEEYWEVNVRVRKIESVENGEFTVQLIKITDKKVEIKNKNTADKVVADLKDSDYKVKDVIKREVVKASYPPFTTSTMTQAASRIFGWSSKKTMSVAQMLYEEGSITYHRTDSTNIAKEAIEKVRNFIKSRYGDQYLPQSPKFYKTTSKVAQEAHEAIRPTNVESGSAKIQNTKYEREGELLYGLIWKRFVSCQMSASVYDETTINVLATTKSSTDTYLLRTVGQIMKFDGWKCLYKKANDVDESDMETLPEVVENEQLKFVKVSPEQKFTQPPARFTESSLIKTLEKLGIGRPSTYAPTINTIQVRTYVEKNEGKFSPTAVGIAVNDFMVGNFPDVFEYQFTAGMEEGLDRIANGDQKWVDLISDFYKPFEKKLVDVEKNAKRVPIAAEKTGEKCPECKEGDVIIRIGRFGKFLSCSRFPECKYTAKYIDKTGIKCPECKNGDVIIKKTKRGRKFFGCSRYPKCKWASWRKPGKAANENSLK
jgi:DNA topoisomerase-1